MLINQKEALRYLGCRGATADEATLETIAQASALLEAQATPRHIYRVFPTRVGTDAVQIGPMRVQSANLARHLRGCGEAALFAATLGSAPDRLAARLAKTDLPLLAALQACSAALLESYCDDCADAIAAKAAARGLFTRPRFSPGYGDFGLMHQQDFIRLLECPKRLGLTLTGASMLAPTKSVTAVIGLTEQPQGCKENKCAACPSTGCAFRREA